MVKNITEDIENKIIDLKNDGKTINNIINDIFNNFNVKITKYGINKIISNYNTQTSTSKSVSLESATGNENHKEVSTEESQKEEEVSNKSNNQINLNNSLIEELHNSESSKSSHTSNKKIIFINEPPIINNPTKKTKIKQGLPTEALGERNNNSIINDVINNVNTGDINDIKEKRSYIIIIRQYINIFEKELKNIYNNKDKFINKLFTLKLDELKILLENIRIHLNISKNSTLFMDCAKNAIIGYEKVMCYSGINLEGLSEDILKNEDFIYDLKCISAEIDMSKYVNCKTSAFLKLVQNSYYTYEKNKIIKNLDEKLNNNDVLNKIKNISLNK